MTKYGLIIGSTRKNSYSAAIAKAIVAGLPEDAQVTNIEIAQLPLYSEDYDGSVEEPAQYAPFRDQVKDQDAFIFVTPEHNRSVPAALKNALDIASRPSGQSVWGGKPALVASQSISGIGGIMANHVLRQSLTVLDMPVMQQPELYIGHSADLVDEASNTVSNESTAQFLASAGQQFAEFAQRFVH